MANGKCPKCGAEKENPKRSYCLKCGRAWQNNYNQTRIRPARTEEQRQRERKLERANRAKETPEQHRSRLDAEKAYRLANPVSEAKMLERREKAAVARSKWSPARHAQQKQAKDAHYARMQLRPALGLCAHSVHCDKPPIGKQRFCLTHWCNGLRQADLRLTSPYTTLELVALWNAQNGKCAITGIALVPGETAALDHIIPVAKNGTSSISNLRFVHTAVNLFKWTSTDEEFKETIRLVCPPLIAWAKELLTA